MNIIKQLQDADGNNIYPIGYAQGGMKMDLLWQNDQPSTSRGAFDITVSTDYDLYIVTHCSDVSGYTPTNTGVLQMALFTLDGHQKLLLYFSTSGGRYQRWITPSANGTINVGAGYYNGSSGNVSCIPEHIYGIKMSYIVPTTVHGLQYIEV